MANEVDSHETIVCLGFAPQDRERAAEIAEWLQDHGIKVFWDFYGIPGGANWRREIYQAIQKSSWYIPLLSPDFWASGSGQTTLQFSMEHGKPILPIIIRQQFEQLPLFEDLEAIDVSRDFNRGIMRVFETIILPAEKAVASKVTQQLANDHKEIPPPLLQDRVFIAYSRKQKSVAQELNNILIRNNKGVFWDAKIKAGARWRQTIQKALDDATHVIVIWTSEAAESDEVEREVSYALAERKVIVPILGKDVPRLPYHLHGLHYIVLEDDLNKIEADLLKAIAQFSDDEDIWQ